LDLNWKWQRKKSRLPGLMQPEMNDDDISAFQGRFKNIFKFISSLIGTSEEKKR